MPASLLYYRWSGSVILCALATYLASYVLTTYDTVSTVVGREKAVYYYHGFRLALIRSEVRVRNCCNLSIEILFLQTSAPHSFPAILHLAYLRTHGPRTGVLGRPRGLCRSRLLRFMSSSSIHLRLLFYVFAPSLRSADSEIFSVFIPKENTEKIRQVMNRWSWYFKKQKCTVGYLGTVTII